MLLRAYHSADLEPIARLFRQTIHEVNRRDYTQAQLDAWAPEQMDLARWQTRLERLCVIVAEREGEVVGFCAWTSEGYIDFLFVHAAHQRQGVAGQLYQHAEWTLRSAGIKKAFTHASITAQPFFARHGFTLVKHQTVIIRGVELANAVMEKEFAQ